MNRTILIFAAACMPLLLVTNGCKEEKNQVAPDNDHAIDQRYAYDHSVAEASFEDAENIADESIAGSFDGFRPGPGDALLTSCAQITLDLHADPHQAVIDFGNTDCLGKDGNYRRGRIIVTWSGGYSDEGSAHTITLDGFYLNFNNIAGTKVVVNEGRNDQGHLVFSVTVSGSVTIDPQYSLYGTSGYLTYKGMHTREWVEGEASPLRYDDVYLIRGHAEGSMPDGVTYTAQIKPDAPLKKEVGFSHFTSGTVVLNANTRGVTELDYHYVNGERDNLARLTVEGISYTIYLGAK